MSCCHYHRHFWVNKIKFWNKLIIWTTWFLPEQMVYQINYRQRKWYYCATTYGKQAYPAYGKICLKCKKLNHFQLVFRSKYKINEIDDTNSNTESYVDICGLYIDHVGSSVITKDNEITLDAAVNDFNIIFKLDTRAHCNSKHKSHYNIQENKKPTKITENKTTKLIVDVTSRKLASLIYYLYQIKT